MSGKGLIFVYNTYTARQRGLSERDFDDFKNLAGKKDVYYQNRTLPYTIPFFFDRGDAENTAVSMKTVVQNPEFKSGCTAIAASMQDWIYMTIHWMMKRFMRMIAM